MIADLALPVHVLAQNRSPRRSRPMVSRAQAVSGDANGRSVLYSWGRHYSWINGAQARSYTNAHTGRYSASYPGTP